MAKRSFNLESYSEEDGRRPHLRKHPKIEEEIKHQKISDNEEEIKHQKIEEEIKHQIVDKASGKSLYICSFELNKLIDEIAESKIYSGGAFVVRAIDLSDLYSGELRQVGYRAGGDLPASAGCSVLGSRIVFASGLKKNYGLFGPPFGPESSTQAYLFDPNDPKHDIVEMDETLQEGKNRPLTVEVAGKLYVLSVAPFCISFNSFEVFDPIQRNWTFMPEFPNSGSFMSCAIAGTKLFVSNQRSPVRCLDLVHPTEWRPVPSMCGGGPFPFSGRALVLDHNNSWIMFTSNLHNQHRDPTKLVVYLLSLSENQETITPIHELNLPPELPHGEPMGYHFLHLGDDNVCLVIPEFDIPDEGGPDDFYKAAAHLKQAAVIPFRFQFDGSKDIANCFTVQFQPPRILEYRTNPSALAVQDTLGCFVL